MLDALLAALITSLFTIVTKITVGRLRPDYLALCQPSIPSNITLEYGIGASSNPECTNGSDMDRREIDGHWSFPSGHASTAFSLATYCVVYVVYTVYWRRNWSLYTSSNNNNNIILTKKRVYLEVAHSVVLLYIMCVWALAWGIAASRVTDYKHHPSDVVAGALLGIFITCSVIARGIAMAPGSRLATSLSQQQESGDSTPTRRLMDQQ
jgi:phosphatidate phosphatase